MRNGLDPIPLTVATPGFGDSRLQVRDRPLRLAGVTNGSQRALKGVSGLSSGTVVTLPEIYLDLSTHFGRSQDRRTWPAGALHRDSRALRLPEALARFCTGGRTVRSCDPAKPLLAALGTDLTMMACR